MQTLGCIPLSHYAKRCFMIGPKSKYRNSSHLFFDLQSWDRAVGSTKTKKIRKSSPRNRKRIATQSPKRFMAQSLANNSKQFLKWLEGMFVLRCFQYYRNAKLYKLLFWNKKHATLEVTMLLSENSEIPNKRHKRSFWPNTPDLSWCKHYLALTCHAMSTIYEVCFVACRH